ncbi:light-harvesting of photosystem I [Micractinium conductrix]|uniref:Chlorophyll a-b binding protein, chloroplastic n=1 Tax=Micractinium conductrix TaxID=554055 RepID=A0A2P6VF46_9CHLO|nr:light-harvesting of photosystem I [Micractinium conductrix]|eukprot:PSC72716.1 light-harvesting of photosystem I [Micractinium conductrix]
MQAALSARTAVAGTRVVAKAQTGRVARSGVVVNAAARSNWLPGSDFPAHLEDCKLPACYGFDPLGLGADPERLKWFAESERVHCRWAMLGVAGIMAQELINPNQFWYTSSAEIELPYDITGLVAFELIVMHWVESRRGYDVKKPGSMDQDPIFSNFKLPAHEVGYPGGVFAPFVPGNLEELKVKEIKNGRLAMLAFVGFVMGAQVTGLNPLAALGEHLSNPLGTTIFSKAVVVPGMAIVPECKIPEFVMFQGVKIQAGCFLHSLWP